jgi:hypothetical protein
MGLLKKLFRGGERSGGASSHFHESEGTAQNSGSANAPRRELIQVVLRDSMRKHGIPSDWMECRILSVVTRQKKTGMHVQFIVRQGEDRLLEFVHPFQETFWRELEKFDAHPREWLFSLAWQFDGDHGANGGIVLSAADAAAEGWSDDTQPPDHDTQPPDDHPDQLASDLQALYAIRDAAMSAPAALAPEPPKNDSTRMSQD